MVTVALSAAYEALGVEGPAGLNALIIGAGSMASLAAASLHRDGARRIVVTNRTPERADRLAALYGGVASPMAELETALAEADLIITCTGAPGYVLAPAHFSAAPAPEEARAVAVADLALPRDVDPLVREIPGLHLIDLERVAADGSAQASDVVGEVEAVRRLVLGEKERAEVEQTVRRVVDKLLHVPTVRVKQLAGAPGGASYAEALRELFGLENSTISTISSTEETP